MLYYAILLFVCVFILARKRANNYCGFNSHINVFETVGCDNHGLLQHIVSK